MASTYTLNNGIELIGTGEQSGTWGDTTNTNLELIDTALDGQVSLTLSSAGSSGSPNALPVSDGASSNGRNRLISYVDGGDLGATAYVQLTPNDAEKIIYIRNALSGSRSIIVFQGTYNASNDYEIPAGTTAVVYFNGGGTGAVAANVFNNAYFDGLRLGSVSVTAILDEDNMASNSATALSTQQSIKAYVDSQVGTVDTLAEVLANGNTTGGTDIAVSTGDDITFADSSKAIFGAGSDLQIYHNGSHSFIKDVGEGNLYIDATSLYIRSADGEPYIVGTANAGVTLYHDNAAKLDTTSTGIQVTGNIANASGDLTLDVAGDIILDAGGQQIVLKDDGTTFAEIYQASNNLYIESKGSDKDIIFRGNDGGSDITALTLDMSEGGRAYFTNGFKLGDTQKAFFGDGNDLEIYHSGSASVIADSGTGSLFIQGESQIVLGNVGNSESYAIFNQDGAVQLRYNNAGKLATTSTGIQVTGNIANASGDLTLDVAGDIILDADGGDIKFKDGGTEIGSISLSGSNVAVISAVQDEDIIFKGNDGGSTIDALTLDMSEAGAATFNGGVRIPGFITHVGDDNTFFGFPAGDQFRLETAGLERMSVNGGGTTFNEDGEDLDFRVESNGQSSMLFVDGGNNKVGVGTSSPNTDLEVRVGVTSAIRVSGGSNTNYKTEIGYDNSTGPYIKAGSSGIQSLQFYVDNTSLALTLAANDVATFTSDVNATNFNSTSDATS